MNFRSVLLPKENAWFVRGQESGLTDTNKLGAKLTKLRKCWNCGGFLPWLGWKMFFLSSFFDVGNGGVLQRPATDYKEVNKNIKNNSDKFTDLQ